MGRVIRAAPNEITAGEKKEDEEEEKPPGKASGDPNVRGNTKRKMTYPAAADGKLFMGDHLDEETNDIIIEAAPPKARLTPKRRPKKQLTISTVSGLRVDEKEVMTRMTQSKLQRMMEPPRK
jgi:hypothetical protein